MKIAINTRFLLPNKLEGIGWYTYEVAKRLVQNHPNDEFFFIFDRPYHQDFIFTKKVTPIVVNPPARHPFLWYTWFNWSLPSALKKLKPDVFFSPDGYCALNQPFKTVMTVHDIAHEHFPNQVPFWVRKYYNRFVPKFVERADKIFTVSEFTKQDLIKQYQAKEAKIEVAYNGSRETFIPLTENEKQAFRKKYTDGQPYFLYVGAVHPRKNVHRLIQAFDELKASQSCPHKLLIAGRFAWQAGPVKAAYDDAENKEDIIFSGYVQPDELPGLTASAFAMTYISLFEGFGLPIVEAMQCDVPVITSSVSSMPEVGGDAAILVNPYSNYGITHALKQLVNDQELRMKMIEKGRVQRQQFSWDETARIVGNELIR